MRFQKCISIGMTLQLEHINKFYGKHHALKSFNLIAKPFEIHGILGFNGCGKSTLFKSIMGLNHLDEGGIYYQGECVTETHRKQFGYMPEQRSMFLDLTLMQHVELIAQLKQLNRTDVQAYVHKQAIELDLTHKFNQRIKTFSKGQQQKAQLILSLMHQPKLLILDEPLNGLDFNSVQVFMNLLRQLSSQGLCILISSHQMDFMDELCTHLTILEQGTTLTQGPLKLLQAQQGYRLRINADSAWQAVNYEAISIEEKGAMIELHYATLEQGKRALEQFSHIASVRQLSLHPVSIGAFLQEAQ
jgi:ABC-2 type transport system ATP-binding protein